MCSTILAAFGLYRNRHSSRREGRADSPDARMSVAVVQISMGRSLTSMRRRILQTSVCFCFVWQVNLSK